MLGQPSVRKTAKNFSKLSKILFVILCTMVPVGQVGDPTGCVTSPKSPVRESVQPRARFPGLFSQAGALAFPVGGPEKGEPWLGTTQLARWQDLDS